MIPPAWSDDERAAFWRGFELARPPGRQELADLHRVKEMAPEANGRLRVAIPKDLARAILAETEALPENLAGATWIGFMRAMVAKAGGEAVYLHKSGTA